MTALEEMGIVLRAVPGPRSSVHEVALWYELKAHLLEHLAGEDHATADRMHRQASAAHQHALALLVEA